MTEFVKKYGIRLPMLAAAAFLAGMLPAQEARAQEVELYYGSSWYEPDYDEDFSVGLYLKSEEGIGSYEITLDYDPNYLSYVDGPASDEGGRLAIEGDLQAASARLMLRFHVLSAGETSLDVEDATIRAADGEEDCDVGELPSAPVRIAPPEDLPFTGMSVNGVEVEDFDAGTLEYEVELEYAEEFSAEVEGASGAEVTEGEDDGQERLLYVAAEDGEGTVTTYRVRASLSEPSADAAGEAAGDGTEGTEAAFSSARAGADGAGQELSEEEVADIVRKNRQKDMAKAAILLGAVVLAMTALVVLPLLFAGRRERKRNRKDGGA